MNYTREIAPKSYRTLVGESPRICKIIDRFRQSPALRDFDLRKDKLPFIKLNFPIPMKNTKISSITTKRILTKEQQRTRQIENRQKQTVREAQRHLRGYINWKKCGTKASYFTQQGLKDHIFHLRAVNTLTNNGKISRKASLVERLYQRILKYEYNTYA